MVESPLPRLANLSLRVLEDFTDPFEGPADVWTLGMESPAAHFSQFAPELSEAHLDVAQPALDGSRPVAAAPALLGLAVRLICHDEFLLVAPRQPPSPGFSSSPKEGLAVRLRRRLRQAIPNRKLSTIMQITLPPETIAALRAWLEQRGLEPGPLFINFDRAGKGRRLASTSIYRIVRELGEQVQVRARPHGLRQAAITAVLDLSHGDVRAAARFSRHADIRTLTVYDDNRQDLGGKMARLVAASL